MLLEATRFASKEVERRGDSERYFNDPSAWCEYMLGDKMWSKQALISRDIVKNRNVAVKAAHGTGKALTLDTPIPTPSGWTTMGALQVGDLVLNEQGSPVPVVAVSDTWTEDTYRVTFDDGTFVDCAAQHEWNVIDTKSRPQGVRDWRDNWGVTRTLETRDLAASVETGGQKRWRVPLTKPLELPAVELPIDPYVFGAWLGDGTSNRAAITTHPEDVEILDRFRQAGYSVEARKGSYCWSFADKGQFISAIRRLNVYQNKHVPMLYLRASIEQRREVLRGLLDTDGHIDARGLVSIDLASELLANGVVELVRSLGGRVTVRPRPMALNGRVVGTRWRMSIRVTDFNPFSLTRKASRWSVPVNQASRFTQRTIVSVERIETTPTRCITVGGHSHLFLAGSGMVPTHNSWLVAVLICWWIDTRYPKAFVASTAPSVKQINAIVWRYVRKMKDAISSRYRAGLIDHELPGYITGDDQWKEKGGNLLGFGRKPPENKEDDSFQGLHDAYVLAVGDEAVGLSSEMIDALGNITSNEGSRRILICNPTNPASYIGKLFREKIESWVFHTISVFDSPNFTGNPDGLSEGALAELVGPSYVSDKKAEYGENSARYKSRVLGEFAYDLGDTLISPEDIAVALDTDIEPTALSRITLGVDIARFGSDKSVIYLNEGGRLRFLKSFDYNTLTDLAREVHQAALDYGAWEVRYDVLGVGQGFEELLWQYSPRPYKMIGMVGNAASPSKGRWHNARAWWWDSMKAKLRLGEIDIDPEDERLQDELMAPEYKYSLQSQGLLVESKDDLKKRGIKSPDFADAAIYASMDLDEALGKVPNGKTQNFEDPEVILQTENTYLDLLVQEFSGSGWGRL